MLGQKSLFACGTRVIRVDSCDFRALTVTGGGPRYIVAVDPGDDSECAGPADRFMAVPPNWPDPPPFYCSERRAVESSCSGPILPETLDAADAGDNAPAALTRKLDAAEAWLAWVETHLHPLSPIRFEPHVLAARTAREAALRRWLESAGPAMSSIAAE
jgi:hypothetical protein